MTGVGILFFFSVLTSAHFANLKNVAAPQNRILQDEFNSIENDRTLSNFYDAKERKDCETEDCRRVAEEIVNSMNKSVNPCEDFYEFSCGGWKDYQPIPVTSKLSSHTTLYENLRDQRLRELLETKQSPNDILPVVQAKKWYRSCLDTESNDRRGINPISSIVRQIGGWPLAMNVSDWKAKKFGWRDVERYYARLIGSNAFYDVVLTTTENSGEIGIAPSELLLSRYRLMDDSQAYKNTLLKVARLFASHSSTILSTETLMNDVEALVAFEKTILELILKSESDEGTDWFPDIMTVSEFVEWYNTNMTEINEDPLSRIDWNTSIQDLFNGMNITVRSSSAMLVRNMGYFKEIGRILKKTSARTLVNYVHWNFIAAMSSHTTEEMKNDMFKLTPEYLEFGVRERPQSWLECVNEMKMKAATAYLFTETFYPNSTKIAVQEMVKNVLNAMKENIDNSNWLDAESRALLKDKLDFMEIITGFPLWYDNETAIVEYYKELTIGNRYFENVLSYTRFQRKKQLMQYVEPFEDNWMNQDSLTVDAEYNPLINSLNVPAVNFQPPIFTKGLPDYVNYGIPGFLFGHEMAHGFDSKGIPRGKYGNKTELSNDTLESFYQKNNCFVNQFNAYYDGKKSSGIEASSSKKDNSKKSRGWKTQSENIADSTGLQAVFRAYKNLEKSTETKLPGLEEFTDEQLLFISFANGWCTEKTLNYEKSSDNEVHSSPRLRIIGAVSNSNDFAKVFNCPAGSPMNPNEKCNIWDKPDDTTTIKQTRHKRTVQTKAPNQGTMDAVANMIEAIKNWWKKNISKPVIL